MNTKHVKGAWGTHTASLAAVLSNTTGRLVADLYQAYKVQDLYAGRPLMTHERGTEANDEALVALMLADFPELAEAQPPDWSFPPEMPFSERKAVIDAWVAEVAAHVGYDTVTWSPA